MALLISWSLTLLYIAIITIVSVITQWLIKYFQIIRRLPPGPWGLPIFGYVFWLSKLSYLDFIKIGKKYGGMFSIGLGTKQYVVLNDWPSVKATLVDRPKIFSGREQTLLTLQYSEGKDVGFTDGEIWRKQRNTLMQAMKFVGMSKKSVEGHLINMIEDLIDTFSNCTEKEVILEPIFSDAISRSNWKLISRYDVVDGESELKKFAEDYLIFIEGISFSNPIAFLPWLRFVPPNGFSFWKYLRSVKRIKEQLRKLINKHDNSVPPDESIISFHIHKFNNIDKNDPPYQNDYLLATIFDLFSASFGTMLSTTLLGFYYLCQYPEIQQRVQNELNIVVGSDKKPSFADFQHLQQLETFILETHRQGSVAPLSLPHKVLETVEINGYVLPKDTVCLQNIYAIHHDPQLWDEPEKFKPERFINDENKIEIPPYFMPFSIGPRFCLGEAFSMMELRLLFACLLQKFTFSFPKNQPQPPLIITTGASLLPAPFPVVVSVRN